MQKLHHVFVLLAQFSSNSKNTNSIKLGKSTFDNKNLNGAIKYASSFLIKMEEYVAEDSVPTDVPSFARGIIESLKPAEIASAKTSAFSGAAKPGQDEPDKKSRRKSSVRRTPISPSLASFTPKMASKMVKFSPTPWNYLSAANSACKARHVTNPSRRASLLMSSPGNQSKRKIRTKSSSIVLRLIISGLTMRP